jgi:hypothetical protein
VRVSIRECRITRAAELVDAPNSDQRAGKTPPRECFFGDVKGLIACFFALFGRHFAPRLPSRNQWTRACSLRVILMARGVHKMKFRPQVR